MQITVKEYLVYQSKDDGKFFSPKIENPFLSNEQFQQDDEKIWQLVAQEEIEK
ncbi:hypothetical protein [Enterococcus mundtii]|uniref:hypothetical protein n=1 Tax=Enterococcus mundtii TaxID=53346 RepID=UPI0014958D45|nr:hypothetical protein [Enterococcus mundtii]